ncbi:MAG: NAD(P)/FAD-dependent oxidoreductase [Actinomycetota bacterium]
MDAYDVIVVGAGPGGSTAATFLAAAGRKVLVLDKKAFPRPKVCGDGLTPRSVRILDEIGLGDQVRTYHRVKGLRLLAAGGKVMELDFPPTSGFAPLGFVRPRKNLDDEMGAAARAAGAEYRTKTEAVAPVFDGRTVAGVRWVRKEPAEGGGVVKAEEGEVRAPFTIVADGASSSFGRALGIRRRPDYPLGLALRTYYTSPRHRDDYFEAWLDLKSNDRILPGYGWIFPVGDGTVNVGVGLLATMAKREVNLIRLQRGYVDMLPSWYEIGHDGQTQPYKSGRLPLGGSVGKPHGDGYVLIGDAAGMINPFTGEGIAYAMETGKLAASQIDAALEAGGTTELASYREALRDIYGAYYRLGRSFDRVLSNPQAAKLLISTGMRSRPIMEFTFQLMLNLREESGGTLIDRGFRSLIRLASFRLSQLKDPEIPAPRRRATAAAGTAAEADRAGAA